MRINLLLLGALLVWTSCTKESSQLDAKVTEPNLKTTPLHFKLPPEVNPSGLAINDADTTLSFTVVYYLDSVNTGILNYSYSYAGKNLIAVQVDGATADYFSLSSDDFSQVLKSQCLLAWEDSYGKIMAKSKFAKWLEKVFIGEKFRNGPCLNGAQDWCRDHWLIGVYGCRIEDC